MSGPKSVSVAVSPGAVASQIARRRRLRVQRRRQLQARAKTLSEQLSRIAEQWLAAGREHGEVFSRWPYGEVLRDLAECEGDSARGYDELKAVLGDLAEQVAQARREYAQKSAVAKMRTSLQAALQSRADESRAAAGSVEDEATQGDERELRRYAEELSRLLGTLAAEVPKEARTDIEERAGESIELSPPFRRKALLAQLRLDIQRANKAADAQQRMVAQVRQWHQQLLGLEGPDVDELDREFRRVVDGEIPLPPGIAQRVEDVVARATEASSRAYAMGVIAEELENLGYVVERGFETAFSQQSEVLLGKPDMEDGYHVSLRAEGSFLHNRVVREARDGGLGSHSRRSADRKRTDRHMERTWCRDLAAALAAAADKGVHGRVVSRKKPGEVPMRTIAALKARSQAKRKRKRRRTGQLKRRFGR